MKELNKTGAASFGIIVLIAVPGALTTYIIYKAIAKLPWLKNYQSKLLLQKHS